MYSPQRIIFVNKIEELNTFTTMLLDYAELQTKKDIPLRTRNWKEKLDGFITFNEYELCPSAGEISYNAMERMVGDKYKGFDEIRRQKEQEEARVEAKREVAEDAKN